MTSIAMAAYNQLIVGKKVELDFTFESDAKAFVQLMRVTHSKQDTILREAGIVEDDEPKQSIHHEISIPRDDYVKLRIWLGEKKRTTLGVKSFRILDDDE